MQDNLRHPERSEGPAVARPAGPSLAALAQDDRVLDGAATKVIRRDLGMHHSPPARPVSHCFDWRGLREAGRLTPATAAVAPPPKGARFRGDVNRGRVDWCNDVSSEPSITVEKVNDPSAGRPTERLSSAARSSVRAAIATLGLPDETAAHTAASHIHAGISRESPGRTSM